MSRHLTDRRLLGALDGDAGRAHLATCATCRARSVRLAHDLAALRGVLRDQPLPPSIAQPQPMWRWTAVAAAVATVALIAWSARISSPPTPAISLERMSRALFSADEVYALTPPVRGDPMLAVQAALRGEWPCARRETCSD